MTLLSSEMIDSKSGLNSGSLSQSLWINFLTFFGWPVKEGLSPLTQTASVNISSDPCSRYSLNG